MNATAGRDLLQQAVAAMDSGDAERGYDLAAALCAAAPDSFQPQHIAGIAALDTNRPAQALEHFSRAVRLAPAPALSAAAWSGVGRAHLLAENFPEAEAAFRRAFSLAPNFGPAFAGLAEAVGYQGHHYEAEHAGKRALELGVDDARLHLALAHAYLGQERLDEAETEFRAALAFDQQAPEPHFGLATLAKFRGDFAAAEGTYREVLTRLPDFPGYDQLANLKTFSAGDEDLTWLERRFAELPPDAPRIVRSDLHFALAKAHDDTGDIAQAVEHLRAGNRLEGQRAAYDPEQDEERIRRITSFVTREFMERYRDAGLSGVKPIFIVSLPRSGSTLTEQMLASHPEIRGGGELGHIARIVTALGARWGARPDFPDLDEPVARQDIREAAREYAQLTAPLRLLGPHFTDKSLNNYLYIGVIRTLLPEARIVHLRRHPLATALGLYRVRFARGITYSSDLGNIARHYRAYTTIMEHWRRTVPDAFIEVQYERLIADPEGELRRILEYAGLAYDSRCLEYYKLNRPVRTASVAQVRRPLDRSGIVRHERYADLMRPVAESLADEIAAYERELAGGAPLPVRQPRNDPAALR